MSRKRPQAEAPPESVDELAFEGALDELESLVERIESGDLPLEEALSHYERGVSLSRRCAELLERAERRIDELTRGGAVRPLPVEEGEES